MALLRPVQFTTSDKKSCCEPLACSELRVLMPADELQRVPFGLPLLPPLKAQPGSYLPMTK